MKTRLALFTTLVALVMPSTALAHRPNSGVAAGHFSAPTGFMCPGGKNGDRCSWYGLTHCQPLAGAKHSVGCLRYSVDKNVKLGGKKYDFVWVAKGSVDHNYHVHGLQLAIVGFVQKK